MGSCSKTRWHSPQESVPYAAYFCLLALTAGANPSFIANQMGHENAQMVYDVYSTWIEEMNGDQVSMLNSRLGL